VERNYRIPIETPSAFLMINADVLRISNELEKSQFAQVLQSLTTDHTSTSEFKSKSIPLMNL